MKQTDIDANKAALDTKADKSEFKKFADQTNANAALLITMAGKVDQNKQDVEALQSDMEKAATAVSTLSDNVKELNSAQNDINENFNNQLLAANQTLDEHQAEIEKIKNLQGYDSLTKVENIVSNKADQDYVEGLEQDVKINTSDIKELSVGIRDNILPAIEANRTDIDKNASRITDTRNKQVLQNARLDNHGERIEANKAAIGELAKATDEAVTNLGNAVSGLDEDLAGTQDAVAENRKDIDKNASRIADTRNKQVLQNARLDNHNSRIDANKADVDTLKNRADGAAAAVNLLAQNIALNKTNIESKADQDYVEGLEQDVKINTSDIKELSKGIRDNILPALEANRTDIDKNASRITDTRNKQVLQNARLDNHGERIEANKAAIGELAKATDEAVTNLGNAVSGLDEDLAGTQDAVAENRKDIDKNASRIADTRNKQVLQNARLDNHNSRIDANKADVDTLKNRADGAAAAVNLLAQNIALNKTNIESKADQDYVEGLEQDVKINTSDIKELSVGIRDNILPALEANRTDIDKNASRITDTRNKQVLQNARLDNHSSRIDANKAALESKADKTALAAKADKTALAAKADKTALEAKADKTALEAKADKTALEAKADKVYVGSLEQNIRDNSNRIETNKVNVSALRNDINSHAKRLDHLDNRVNKLDKDLKRGLATQAALTGLFQPYTVGKANFTAAVGGYKSQTAVAIGTGYRYNKHVATKAGVAFTQGGAAYNVGVNFEW